MVHMSTYETLDDDAIEDEYNVDEMEHLEDISTSTELVVLEPVHAECYWETNAFRDISAWNEHLPDNEFLGLSGSVDNDLYLGRIWTDKEAAKSTVEKYSIEKRVQFRISRSNHDTLEFVCKSVNQNCPWEIKIKKKAKASYWTLKTYKGDHTCNRTTILSDNFHLNPKMIAMHFVKTLKENLRLEARRIQADVAKDFGYKIKYLKAWQAKQAAMEIAFGTWEESFRKLPQLMAKIQEKNPGTFVKWQTSPLTAGSVQIDRVFWAFGPSIRAFEHCRPVLSVDGTHLYGKYNGRLLVAIGLDADNQLVPVAFALVESENTSSWKWFMRCIREGVTGRDGICIISDRHNGILAAMNTLEEWMPPRAYHRFCLRHLKSNFNEKLGREPELKKELGRIGYIVDPQKFQHDYSNLLQCLHHSPNVRDWLTAIPVQKWSIAHDEGRRWGSMTTNASECFNKILKSGRDLPISALVMFTLTQTNEYFVTRRDLYKDYPSPFAPKIDVRLQELIEQSKYFSCILFDRENMIVQVQVGGIHDHFEVNMSKRTCSCGQFVAYHHPCSHALAVCRDFRLDMEEYVPYEYTMIAYNLTWSQVFGIVPPERTWETYTDHVHSPNPRYRRGLRGRPPTKRIPNEMDWSDSQRRQTEERHESGETSENRQEKRVQRCTTCGVSGHNSRRCPVRNMS